MVIYVSSFKIFLKTFVISGWCLVLFIGLGYYYIESQNIKVENKAESVPYYSQIPENKSVLIKMGTRSAHFFMDFEAMEMTVTIAPDTYGGDFTIDADYSLLSDICNYFDGIDIMRDAETLRYTGEQVVDLLSSDNSDKLRVDIISAILSKMAEQGVGADFFNMIITKSKTNMKMPDCYFWAEYMDDLSLKTKFVSDN